MKILILNWRDLTHPKSGGAERVTMEHARAWSRDGHQVTWLTAGYAKSKKEELIDGVRIKRLGGSMTVYLFVMWYVFRRSKRYDVIVDEFHGLPFFAPLLTRIPVIAFIHEVAGEIWRYTFPFPISSLGMFIEKCSFFAYTKVQFWTDAPSMIPELERYGIDRKNIMAIPCPIPGKAEKISVPKEEEFTCLFVNRIVPMKGIESVLKAFQIIQRQETNAKLWVIGKGDERYEAVIRNHVREMMLESCVTFFGHVEEVEKNTRMARAHILLHASVKEGWGLVVLEAALQGTPSVVYNVTGLQDVVKNNETGIILTKNSPDEMATKVLELFSDKKKYRQFQKNGVIWAESFRWEDVTQQSIALLSKVI